MLTIGSSTDSTNSDEASHEKENHVCLHTLTECETIQPKLVTVTQLEKRHCVSRHMDVRDTSSLKTYCSPSRNRSSRSSYEASPLAACFPALWQADPLELNEDSSNASRKSSSSRKVKTAHRTSQDTYLKSSVYPCSKRQSVNGSSYSSTGYQAQTGTRRINHTYRTLCSNPMTRSPSIQRYCKNNESSLSNPPLSRTTSQTRLRIPNERNSLRHAMSAANRKPRWSYAGPNSRDTNRCDQTKMPPRFVTSRSDSSVSPSKRCCQTDLKSKDYSRTANSLCSPRGICHQQTISKPRHVSTIPRSNKLKSYSYTKRCVHPSSSLRSPSQTASEQKQISPFEFQQTLRKYNTPTSSPIRVILTPASRKQPTVPPTPPPRQPNTSTMFPHLESRSTQTETDKLTAIKNSENATSRTSRGTLQVSGDQRLDIQSKPSHQQLNDFQVIHCLGAYPEKVRELSFNDDEWAVPNSVSKVKDGVSLNPISLPEEDRTISDNSVNVRGIKQPKKQQKQQRLVITPTSMPLLTELSLNQAVTGQEVPIQKEFPKPVGEINKTKPNPFTTGDESSEKLARLDANMDVSLSVTQRPPSPQHKQEQKVRSILRNPYPTQSVNESADSKVISRNSSAPARLVIKAYTHQDSSKLSRKHGAPNRLKGETVSPHLIELQPSCFKQELSRRNADISFPLTSARPIDQPNYSNKSAGSVYSDPGNHYYHHLHRYCSPSDRLNSYTTKQSQENPKLSPTRSRYCQFSEPVVQPTVVEHSEDLVSSSERSMRTPDAVSKRLTSITQPLLYNRSPRQKLNDPICCCCAYHNEEWHM